jgi:uncharacterized SAM-binding protein YcdF (DUF218 family)
LSFLLTKSLSLFVLPLGFAVSVGLVVFLLEFTNLRRSRQALLAVMLLVLWITATPIFSAWLNWHTATACSRDERKNDSQSDAIILLGGTPISRILHALALYQDGKAPLIVITGGNLPWQDTGTSEAQRVANRLVKLGAPRSALILETKSRNTRENAVGTSAIFTKRGWKKGLLVTSSTHMPRALAAFRKAGIEVAAAPTDCAGVPRIRNILDILPDVEALARTTFAIKELFGFYVYQSRGWV